MNILEEISYMGIGLFICLIVFAISVVIVCVALIRYNNAIDTLHKHLQEWEEQEHKNGRL